MNQLIQTISSDIDWRTAEISNFKIIPVKYNFSEQHLNSFIMYTVPSMYSLWEGFVKNTFEVLTRYLNTLGLNHDSIHINLLTHTIENQLKIGNERHHFDKKKKFIIGLKKNFDAPLKVEQGIPTESNINFKVTNKILERFNIQPLNDAYNAPLDRFLLFRNKISHGENSIVVTRKDINEFALLIQSLMHEIAIKIEDYLNSESYREVS
nr:MAE_28990/MAE_18760 family HEPN-like nuclease [uncultured Desulfobacter sp.]